MGIIQLCELLELLSDQKIYPLNFPDLPNDLVKLEITTGMSEVGGVFDFNIELGIKSDHPKEGERMGIDMINKFHRKTDVEYEGHQLILMMAEKPYPSYEGVLEDGSFYFTCNFRVMTSKL